MTGIGGLAIAILEQIRNLYKLIYSRRMRTFALLALLALAACGQGSGVPANATFGPGPRLAQPNHALVPTVKFAKPVGWPAGRAPVAAAGLKVEAYARGLAHPRWLYVLPNGDVLVAETNSPPAPPPNGFRGFAEKIVMGMVGAAVPSPNRIVLLHGLQADGSAQSRSVFL